MKFLSLSCALIMLMACSNLPITKQPSKGQNARIQSLILHFTAGNYKRSMFALRESGAVSAHYLVPSLTDDTYDKSSLEIIQLVDESQRAWHAGYSHWQGRDNLNDTSIGIEIVNEPLCKQDILERNFFGGEFGDYRQCEFPQFDEEQIELVVKLAKDILSRHPDIDPTRVVGHSDIAPARKNDPGPAFPWFELYQQGVGAWYEQETFEQYQAMFEIHPPALALLQRALLFYGYKIKVTGELDAQTQGVIRAFKFHFLPNEPDAVPTITTYAAVFALIERYREEYLRSLLSRYFNDAYVVLGGQQVADDVLTDSERLAQQSLRQKITERTLAFNAVTGVSTLTIKQPSIAELPQLKLHLNGRYISLDFAVQETGRLEVDLGRWTRNGKNVVQVSSDSDLSNIQLQVTGTELRFVEKPELSMPMLDRFADASALNGAIFVARYGEVVKAQQYGKPPKPLVLTDNSHLFTTYLALFSLASERGVSLDDFLETYLPEYQVAGASARQIKHLLQHTSGYGELAEHQVEDMPEGTENRGLHRAYVLSQLPFQFSLGTHYVSDTNTYVLNQLVEGVSGMTLQQYLNHYVWWPLGLKNTSLIYDGVSELPSLKTDDYELLVLMQLLMNHGRYGQVQVFDENSIFNWYLNQQSLPSKYNSEQISAMACVPYLTEQSFVVPAENGQLYVLDHEHQLLLLVTASHHQQLDTSRFSCGLSMFHQDILNHVYQQVFQGQL
ncbi:MAG: N-acetylmuramoyl-L-alanine amidase [Gammaproteobacteria bacterium]|nr:N-acetylmuramoyl-L-alanine amidase [Gammaproteobacteria bacterium]